MCQLGLRLKESVRVSIVLIDGSQYLENGDPQKGLITITNLATRKVLISHALATKKEVFDLKVGGGDPQAEKHWSCK